MKYRFIGDVHGKIGQYLAVTDGVERSVQVGDMGLGFDGVVLPKLENHKFIRGNHDSPSACLNHPNWIHDGTYKDGIFYCGGAWSIDYALREENVSWWRDEEVSTEKLNELVDFISIKRPKIMVTHDCPYGVVKELFGITPYKTKTQMFLEAVREISTPDIHIFGHWHHNVDRVINGTRYICLNELSYIDLDM